MSMTWDDYLKWLDELGVSMPSVLRSLPDPDQPSAAQVFADTGGKVTPKGQELPPKEYTAPPLSYGDLIGGARPLPIETPEPIHPLELLGCRFAPIRATLSSDETDPRPGYLDYNVTIG